MYEYTINKCAEMIGKDRASLARLLRSVPADAGTEKRPLYRLATVVKALIEQAAKPDGRRGNGDEARLAAERARLAREQADAVAMKNAITRREWAHVPSITRFLENMFLSMRDQLLGLAGETAYALAMQPQEECFRILDDAIRSKLEEISDPKTPERAVEAGISTTERTSEP